MGAGKIKRTEVVDDGFDAAMRAVLEDVDDDPVDLAVNERVAREKEARQIPVVVSVRGKLTCSQCGDRHVRVAAFFRTEDYRRTVCVCAACLKSTSEAADAVGCANG